MEVKGYGPGQEMFEAAQLNFTSDWMWEIT